MVSTQPTTQLSNLSILVESCKKAAVKYFLEKYILVNFADLSTTFCPRLYAELLLYVM